MTEDEAKSILERVCDMEYWLLQCGGRNCWFGDSAKAYTLPGCVRHYPEVWLRREDYMVGVYKNWTAMLETYMIARPPPRRHGRAGREADVGPDIRGKRTDAHEGVVLVWGRGHG